MLHPRMQLHARSFDPSIQHGAFYLYLSLSMISLAVGGCAHVT